MDFKEAEQIEEKGNDNAHCAEEEKQKLALMRAKVEKEDSSAKNFDDMMLRRFLRARDLDPEKAAAQFLGFLSWRRVAMPKGHISESEIPNQLAEKKMFVQGFDKEGRRIGVALGAKHLPRDRDLEEFKRLVVYILEKLCRRLITSRFRANLVFFDLQGWGYSHCDIRAYLAALSILQDYYPERLGKLYIVHVPYIFMAAWKIVYPFIDKNTRKKIVFVEDKSMLSTLLEGIDESQIPQPYGGKMPLVPIEDSTD